MLTVDRISPQEEKKTIPFGIKPEIYDLIDYKTNLEDAQKLYSNYLFPNLREVLVTKSLLSTTSSVDIANQCLEMLKVNIPSKTLQARTNFDSLDKLSKQYKNNFNEKIIQGCEVLKETRLQVRNYDDFKVFEAKIKNALIIFTRYKKLTETLSDKTLSGQDEKKFRNIQNMIKFQGITGIMNMLNEMQEISSRYENETIEKPKEISREAKELIKEIKGSVDEFKLSLSQTRFLENFIESLEDPILTVEQISNARTDFYKFLAKGDPSKEKTLEKTGAAGDLEGDVRVRYAYVGEPETIAKKISNQRRNLLLKLGGISASIAGIGLAVNSFIKQPEIAFNPVVNQPKTESALPNRIQKEAVNQELEITKVNEKLVSPQGLKITKQETDVLQGVFSNAGNKFNVGALERLLTDKNLDSNGVIRELFASMNITEMQNRGILILKKNAEDLYFEIKVPKGYKLTEKDNKTTPQIKTALQLQREQADKKTVV